MRRSRIALAVLIAAAVTQGAAFAADPGAALFAEHCAMCHGANGEGLPGFGPPLAGPAGKRIEAPGGREYLAQVVVYGISGVFELAGQRQFAAMTPQGKLSDDELAAVLNHVLRAFNGSAATLAPADIAAARKTARTPGELHRTKVALDGAKR